MRISELAKRHNPQAQSRSCGSLPAIERRDRLTHPLREGDAQRIRHAEAEIEPPDQSGGPRHIIGVRRNAVRLAGRPVVKIGKDGLRVLTCDVGPPETDRDGRGKFPGRKVTDRRETIAVGKERRNSLR